MISPELQNHEMVLGSVHVSVCTFGLLFWGLKSVFFLRKQFVQISSNTFIIFLLRLSQLHSHSCGFPVFMIHFQTFGSSVDPEGRHPYDGPVQPSVCVQWFVGGA